MATDTAPKIQVNNVFVYVDDADKALPFYRDVLGLTVKDDINHEGFRWLTLTSGAQPELEITIQELASCGLPMSGDDKQQLELLMAKGLLGGLIFDTADVDATFESVRSSGAEIIQEPTDQFYGVRDCAFRDPAGNMVRFKTDKGGYPG